MYQVQVRKAKSIVERFATIIRGRMAEQDLSMTALARESGVTRPYLYRVLNGTQTPSMDVAEKIATAVGLELNFSEKSSPAVVD